MHRVLDHRPPSRAAGPAPVRGRRGFVAAVVTAAFAAACADRGVPALIAYPYYALGPAIVRVVQPAIDAWGSPRVADIPEWLMRRVRVRRGYAGDVDYAEAMTALPGLSAAVGPPSSRATLLVAPIYAERRIPLICATATSSRLRGLGPWIFQLAPDDDMEGTFIATFLLDRLRARRVTIFYLAVDEYGLGLRDGVVKALRQRGVAPVDQVGIVEASDFPRRVAVSLRRAVPDVVVIAARSAEAAAIVRAVHARLPGTPVLVGDGVPLDQAFVRAVGDAAPRVYAVTWWQPDTADAHSRGFADRFARAAGRAALASDAMFYDAVMVAAQAAREVGPRPEAIGRYLRELGSTRPAYRGVTGPISFVPRRPVNLSMTHVVGGAPVVVSGPGGSR